MAKQIELHNGTKLTVRGIPALLILAVSQRYPEPTVPKWYNDAKQREEENPTDPTYLQALKDHAVLLQDKTIDCFLANGIVVDEVGPDCTPLEDDTWLENTEFTLDMELPRSGAGRRVAWLRHHVLDQADDLGNVVTEISVASGLVTEAAVRQAAESFRNTEVQPADPGDTSTSDSGLRDTSEDAARDGDGVRVQGDSQVLPVQLDNVVDFR